MKLSRWCLGDLINKSEETNQSLKYGPSNVKGISVNKCFLESKANVDNIDLKSFKVVKPGYFAFNTATSRNGEKISIAFNDSNDTYIVSSLYSVFYISPQARNILSPDYLNMFFCRDEFDRYARVNSWGSAREYFRHDDLSKVIIELPDLETQKKYVAIYKGMFANLRSYEKGLEDLKLVCDGYIESLRKNKEKLIQIIDIIESTDVKNRKNEISIVMGLSTQKEFREANSRVDKSSLSNYKIVKENQFAYVPTTDTWKCFAYAINTLGEPIVVSPLYQTFKVNEEMVLPEYLELWLRRKEFDRYARFNSWGSARENIGWDDLCSYRIPLPSINSQKSIVDIFKVLKTRKLFIEKLRNQINGICSVLIHGSILESKGGN